MALLSPVSKDSLTSIVPLTTILSAQIWFPASYTVKSSNTTLPTLISFFTPQRITVALGAESRDSRSIVFLAFNSW